MMIFVFIELAQNTAEFRCGALSAPYSADAGDYCFRRRSFSLGQNLCHRERARGQRQPSTDSCSALQRARRDKRRGCESSQPLRSQGHRQRRHRDDVHLGSRLEIGCKGHLRVDLHHIHLGKRFNVGSLTTLCGEEPTSLIMQRLGGRPFHAAWEPPVSLLCAHIVNAPQHANGVCLVLI